MAAVPWNLAPPCHDGANKDSGWTWAPYLCFFEPVLGFLDALYCVQSVRT